MADSSSFMDWEPQTPEPAFNPYQGDYMPGGWPAEPSTPPKRTTGAFDPPRRRGRLDDVLPVAKRVCVSLLRTTVATVTVASKIVTVPTYAVVREVRRRQAERARRPAPQATRPARRVRIQTPPPRTPPQQARQHAATETSPPKTPEQQPRQVTIQTPEQQDSIRATPQSKKQEEVTVEIPFEVPEFRPDYVRNPRRPNFARRKLLRDAFPGIVRLSPRQIPQAIVHPRPTQKGQQSLPDAKNVQIRSPVPLLVPQPATPQSPAISIATDDSVTPSAQIQGDLQAATPGTPLQGDLQTPTPITPSRHDAHPTTESDTDGDTVVSSVTTSRKRRIDVQGSREIDGHETSNVKRVQIQGPSFASPKTPTPHPAIVVQPAVAAATVETPSTPVNTSLLSPSQFRRRKISSTSLKTPKTLLGSPKTPQSAQTDFSSTCGVSPGNYHIDGLDAARSPVKSEISSFFEGTPPPFSEQNAQVFKMITTGGGSPTPISKNISRSEEVLNTNGSNPGNAQAQALGHGSTGKESAVEETKMETPQDIAITTSEVTEMNGLPVGLVNQEALSYSNNTTEAFEQITPSSRAETECKESSTSSTTQQTTTIIPPIDLTDDKETSGSSSSCTSTTSDPITPVKKLAQLTLNEHIYQTPDQSTPKAAIHSAEKTTRKTRAITRLEEKVADRSLYDLVELTSEWQDKVQEALRKGTSKFSAGDFLRVVPLTANSRGTDAWLNDEVINGYLSLVTTHGKKDDRTTQVPSYHAFSSFFYTNLESKGHEGVKRWANRAKIGGKNLLETQAVFIPINTSAHWTLLVVSGKDRTATHYNSMRGSGRRYIAAVKTWLAGELGGAYNEPEWTFVEAGESPLQANMDDCGVFTITSARQIMLGLTPMSYGAETIPLQRQRIVAELVAGELLKSNV